MSSRLMVMLIGSVFCAQPLLFAGTATGQQAYVVTVRPDASIDGIPVIARQMAASYGGTVVEGAGGGGDAFVIRVAQSRARMLSLDPHVKSVVPMSLTPAPQTVVETVPWSSGVSYSYDGTGNITQIGNDTFAYDGVSRLSQATVNGIARKYDYDVFGNRTACTQIGPNDCQGFLINAAENKNRLAGAGYDAAGNVTGLSGHVYSYDPLNMMTRDSFGQLSREFVYTADDERIATYTVGSSWNWTVRGTDGTVLREFTSGDGPAGPGTSSWIWTKDHVWRNALLLASRQPDGANTTTYHYHLDHLGTPRRVTDQNDRIVGVHDYLAFGPELSGATAEPSATVLKYTGHERDNWSSGSSDALDYMHARYYSSWTGRFLSVDRHIGNIRAPLSWNRYSYARNNPVRLFDPDGEKEIEFTIRHFIQQHHVLSPFGNLRGDNRGFSLDKNASRRTDLVVRIETDRSKSRSGLLSQTADTGVSHNFSMGVTTHADPNNWHNEIAATASRDSAGNVVLNVKTYASEPFPNTLLGPFTPPITSEAQITISPDGNTILATGFRTSSPSLEINATEDGDTFAVYRGDENALFMTGLFTFTPFNADCVGSSCEQSEGYQRDTPP